MSVGELLAECALCLIGFALGVALASFAPDWVVVLVAVAIGVAIGKALRQ